MYKCLEYTETIILCGGEGTRMKEMFPNIPKCLIEVGGLPFIEYLIDQLRYFGCQRIILACKEEDERPFTDFVSNYYIKHNLTKKCNILWIFTEKMKLGTGGAILTISQLCNGDRIFITNGDSIVTNIDMINFFVDHVKDKSDMSMYAATIKNVGFNTELHLEKDYMKFAEKNNLHYINAGIYLIRKKIISTGGIPEYFFGRECSFENELIPYFDDISVVNKPDVRCFIHWESVFKTIGDPDSYKKVVDNYIEEAK